MYLPAAGPLLGLRSWPSLPVFIYRFWPLICIYRIWLPICISRPRLPICIYRLWPTILLPAHGLSLHIPTLSLQFIFIYITALAYDLYYRSGAWICIYFIIGSSSSGSYNSSSNNFFVIENTNICMPILVN